MRNKPEHDERVRNNACDTEVQRRERVLRDDIFENQEALRPSANKQTTTTLVLFKTYHGPSQTASDQGKPHEQDQLGFPCHPVTAVRIAVGDQPRLLDRVDPGYQRTSATGECVGAGGGGGYVHEHSQHAADQRDPVRERDMDITVVRDLAVHRGIDEEPES